MIKLERPNAAVNDPRVRPLGPIGRHGHGKEPEIYVRRYRMKFTWDITATESRQNIIDWVVQRARKKKKLKNLVLSCHGEAGVLRLGQGFDNSNVALFAAWRGLIEKIWIPGCSVAFIGTGGSNGNVFCSKLAQLVQCYVVASTEDQCDEAKTFPIDEISSFEGLVLSYDPGGNISWQGRNPSTWHKASGECVPVPD